MAALVGGSARYDFMPRGGSSRQQLCGAELAGLLSGLSSVAVDLAYALYACDEIAQAKLRAHMQVYAVSLACDEGWDVVRGQPTITRMGILSVFELLSSGLCNVCHGPGQHNGHECDMCRGVGRVPTAGRQRASFIFVSQNQWQRVWADRYARIFAYLQGLDADVRYVISRNSRAIL